MENFFKLLPGPQPALVRIGTTIVLVMLSFAFRLGLTAASGRYGFIIFIPAIVASALIFDRGSGLLALGLSTVLIASLLDWSSEANVHVGAFATFVTIGSCLVFVADGLHRALKRAHDAEQEKDLLLREMTHRVKNKFAIILSMVSLQGREASPDTKKALNSIASRVRVIANIHDFLQLTQHDGLVDMREYLRGLCTALEHALCTERSIVLNTTLEAIHLHTSKALSVGLIVNELVTNAVKYAFPGDAKGSISVQLKRTSAGLELTVSDDGTGCVNGPSSGLGNRLVTMLAEGLPGRVERADGSAGCLVTVSFAANSGS